MIIFCSVLCFQLLVYFLLLISETLPAALCFQSTVPPALQCAMISAVPCLRFLVEQGADVFGDNFLNNAVIREGHALERNTFPAMLIKHSGFVIGEEDVQEQADSLPSPELFEYLLSIGCCFKFAKFTGTTKANAKVRL